jgi:hypothetical protein
MRPKLIPQSKEIIPKWSKKIKSGNMNREFLKAPGMLDIEDFRFCVVGEANGFSDDYRKTCDDCNNFGKSIAESLKTVKITYRGGIRRIEEPSPQIIDRMTSRTNRFLEHFIKKHSHLRK